MKKQKSARLYNGQKVKKGDVVSFVNSDGEKCTDKIRRRNDGKLFFWNNGFDIKSYRSANKQ